MMKKSIPLILALLAMMIAFSGCNKAEADEATAEPVTITLAAAASLKNTIDGEIIPAFQKENPGITVQATYDASGKLQTQIESGAAVDVFMSAATTQMDALNAKGLLLENSVLNLLENKLVLIVPKNSTKGITAFTDILKADKIAIGDPASVPAGKYAQEALAYLKIWDQAKAKASLGTNVTEVLNWVAEGSADAGIVYSTDALANAKVKIVAEAPAGSVSKVLYPVGIIKASANQEAAKKFVKYLQTDAAIKVFVNAGFTAVK